MQLRTQTRLKFILKAMPPLAMILILLLFSSGAGAQNVGINNDGSDPDNSALLEVKSNTKGLLPPRMTHQQLVDIPDPANGLMVFCTDCGSNGSGALAMFMSGTWKFFNANCLTPGAPSPGAHIPNAHEITWTWNASAVAGGFRWSTTNDFSTATDMGTTTSTTETGLSSGVVYTSYVWAYNACGHSTAATLTQTTTGWICGNPITDIRDGKQYNTVSIGTQCWFAQNLNIGTRITASSNQTNHNAIEKYCYDNFEANCGVYGGLYQWDNAMQWTTAEGAQGICPAGWHLPTSQEWNVLTAYLGGNSVAGGKMKETGYAHWISPNTGATNSSGLTALPGGNRMISQVSFSWFGGQGMVGFFWSSSQSGTKGYGLSLDNTMGGVYPDFGDKILGLSCRCLKN
jgi:uncharacterized protein (TIGR02145 family)